MTYNQKTPLKRYSLTFFCTSVNKRKVVASIIIVMLSSSYLKVIHFTNFILGMMPVKKYSNKVSPIPDIDRSIYATASEADASISKFAIHYGGFMFWLLLSTTTAYQIRHNIAYMREYIDTKLDSCFQKNFCLPLVEMTIMNAQPLCHLCFIAQHRIKQKLACTQRVTEYFYNLLQSDKESRPSHGPFLLFIFFHVLAMCNTLLKAHGQPFWYCFCDYYLLASCVTLNCTIMTFCHIVCRIYVSVNQQIEDMISGGRIDEQMLLSLQTKHWQASDLSVDISMCYGLNLLFSWPYHIVHTITLLMNVLDHMSQKIHANGALIDLMQHLIRILIFLSEIIYFSQTGTLMASQAERTKICIEKLKLRFDEKLSTSNKQVIKKFVMKLNARKIQLTASDFLQINMQLIQSFLGLIITYWIVLVQFRNNI